MYRSLPADAAPFPLASTMVEGCLDLDQLADQVFARAWRGSLAALSPAERRGALAGVTGHVAESVVELLLAEVGYQLLWHFTGPGRHGVDLIVLCPAGERVVAVEVKGSLRPRYWPRLSRRLGRERSEPLRCGVAENIAYLVRDLAATGLPSSRTRVIGYLTKGWSRFPRVISRAPSWRVRLNRRPGAKTCFSTSVPTASNVASLTAPAGHRGCSSRSDALTCSLAHRLGISHTFSVYASSSIFTD